MQYVIKFTRMSSEAEDRLSELPDSLIFNIIGLLPMRDVVRTTVLSKRWENLWTTIPYLNFDAYTRHDSADKVGNFVKQALALWRGIKILKFKIDFSCFKHRDSLLLFSDIVDVWVRFVKEKEVEELYLHLMEPPEDIFGNNLDKEAYWLKLDCLDSCSSLKVLYLRGCNLYVDRGIVQWDQLKSLTIDGFCIGENVINHVLSGSPQLENLILTIRQEIGENLSNIQSSSLKYLLIDKNLDYDDGPLLIVRHLRIWTPNLETLEIWGYPYSKCLLMNMASLTHATLGFYGNNHLVAGNNFLGETVRQIFPTIQCVENLTLSYGSFKGLADMKRKDLVSPFPNVKFLKLNDCYKEYEEIVNLLELFPKLKTLVLQDNAEVHNHSDTKLLKFDEAKYPKSSFLVELRTVEIIWVKGDNLIFPFIEIVFKDASNLEKMVFRVEEFRPSKSLLFASQKLLRMRRSSPTAELIFCECDDIY